MHSRPYTNLYLVRFEVFQAVLLKIWDVTLRGQAVQIILGLHDPADKDTMTFRGQAVQIILGLQDPADRGTMVLLNVQKPLAQRHGVTSRETGNFNLHVIICIKEMT